MLDRRPIGARRASAARPVREWRVLYGDRIDRYGTIRPGRARSPACRRPRREPERFAITKGRACADFAGRSWSSSCSPRRAWFRSVAQSGPRAGRLEGRSPTPPGRPTAAAPHSAQFTALNQINKTNVSQLQVAWTYPVTGNDHVQPDRGGQRDVRAGHRQRHRGARRRHRQGDLDASEPGRHRRARPQLLGEPGPLRPPAASISTPGNITAIDARTGADDHVVRHQRPRGPAHGAVARRPQPAADQQPGAHLRRHRSSCRCRRRAPATKPTRPTCRPTTCAPARCGGCSTPSRYPGEFGYDTWPDGAFKTAGGVHNWSELTVDEAERHRLHPDRHRPVRLLRRQPSRREPLRQQPRGARRAHRQAAVAPAAGAPRPVGLRPAAGAEAAHAAPERPQRRCGGAGHEDGLRLRVRAQDRHVRSSRSRSGRCRRPTCRAR